MLFASGCIIATESNWMDARNRAQLFSQTKTLPQLFQRLYINACWYAGFYRRRLLNHLVEWDDRENIVRCFTMINTKSSEAKIDCSLCVYWTDWRKTWCDESAMQSDEIRHTLTYTEIYIHTPATYSLFFPFFYKRYKRGTKASKFFIIATSATLYMPVMVVDGTHDLKKENITFYSIFFSNIPAATLR